MAVRHLKSYVSWVQTVEHLIYWMLDPFEPLELLLSIRKFFRLKTNKNSIEPTMTRRSYIGIYTKPSTNIGGTQLHYKCEGNTEGSEENARIDYDTVRSFGEKEIKYIFFFRPQSRP